MSIIPSAAPNDTSAAFEAKVYASLVSFNGVACWSVLQQAQMRQYLAEHLTADLAPEVEVLRARVAQLENALTATGRSLSSFIFDSDDPGADAMGAQWLYGQAMPQADDPFAQPRAFRSSVFSEASKAVEELDGHAHQERPQAYLDGYSDGVLDAAERLEKLADQAAEGSEVAA